MDEAYNAESPPPIIIGCTMALVPLNMLTQDICIQVICMLHLHLALTPWSAAVCTNLCDIVQA